MKWGWTKLMKQGALACAVLLCAVVPAYAEDPLLSGYSGPGGGEQVVIGSSVLPPKNGNGSIRSGSTGASAPSASAGKTTDENSSDKPSDDQQASVQPSTPAPAVASKPAYPTQVSSASSLPLSRGDLILIAVAAVLVLLVGLGATRLRRASA